MDLKQAWKKKVLSAAAGLEPAELVLKNASFVNVFTSKVQTADIAICCGVIAGIGSYHGLQELDMTGKVVVPGLIDAHMHIETSMVSPAQLSAVLTAHGTTTLITDPHEIANVMGADGIRYMLQATEGLTLDVRVMLPSCVPGSVAGGWECGTARSGSGAVLQASSCIGPCRINVLSGCGGWQSGYFKQN